ncbi:MAG: hypothetical protein U1E89_00330 [Burkholderiaceae bacterium]
MRSVRLKGTIVFGLAWLLAGASASAAEQGSGAGIYSCIGPDGKPSIGDRLNPDCKDKDQKEHRQDGATKSIRKPPPTADEQARIDAELQRLREASATRSEAEKYDRLLKVRYPNRAAHDRKRAAELERLQRAVAASEQRLREMGDERKRLMDEAEFYKGRKMPDALKQRIDANGATTSAQKQLLKQQQDQIDDINRLYDAELERLQKLWNGAQPGSLGPVPGGSGR